MYKIIGADGKEYGPIPTETLKQWIAEGRVNAQTQVLVEGAATWQALASVPELAAALPPTPLPTAATVITGVVSATDQVNGPAIGLIVTAILGFLIQSAGLAMNLLGISVGAMQHNRNEAWVNMFSGTLGIISGIVGLAVSFLILFGALKMKKLQSHGWGVAASIIALVPCISPCCLVGLPIGIWALVVLNKPEIKAAFPKS